MFSDFCVYTDIVSVNNHIFRNMATMFWVNRKNFLYGLQHHSFIVIFDSQRTRLGICILAQPARSHNIKCYEEKTQSYNKNVYVVMTCQPSSSFMSMPSLTWAQWYILFKRVVHLWRILYIHKYKNWRSR